MPFIKCNIKLRYFGPKFSMHFFFDLLYFLTVVRVINFVQKLKCPCPLNALVGHQGKVR